MLIVLTSSLFYVIMSVYKRVWQTEPTGLLYIINTWGELRVQAKNYTNPEDRGRFGFSMSGEYRSPYKVEGLLVTLLVGLGVVAGLVILFSLSTLWRRNQMEQDTTSTFVFIGCIIALVVSILAIIMIFGVGIRSVKKGFLCKYSANDETFTATIGGDLHVIHYKDVIGVTFQPRSSLGKIRGYDIIVRIGAIAEKFSICSDGYLSPQATPFYIIQERMEILRRPSSTTQINTAHSDTRAITKAEVERAQTGSVSAMDKMAQLLGETSNMPELSASQSYSQRAAAEVTKLLNAYSNDEMPSVGQKPRQNPDTYIGKEGREHPITEIHSQGIFYIKPKRNALLLAGVGSGILYCAVLIAAAYYILVGSFGIGEIFGPIIAIAAVVTTPFVIYHFSSRLRGPLFNYRADGRGFYITSKAGNSQILYKDVLSVDYTATKFLWKAYGYKVDILTTYGLITYDYIFPHFGHKVPMQYIPFTVIRDNIPKKENDEQ